MDLSLFDYPWEVLLTVAAGYAGYFVANTGLREHHKAIDVTFSTAVFGFFATGMYLFVGAFLPFWLASISAFLFAAVLGAIWNKHGRSELEWCLRTGDVSLNNELPSAWLTMFSAKDVYGRQLHVLMSDGTWLKCEDLRRFADAPNGPCTLGAAGDVLMYVTHQRKKGEVAFTPIASVRDAEWGDEVTYIPTSQIVRIDFRRK